MIISTVSHQSYIKRKPSSIDGKWVRVTESLPLSADSSSPGGLSSSSAVISDLSFLAWIWLCLYSVLTLLYSSGDRTSWGGWEVRWVFSLSEETEIQRTSALINVRVIMIFMDSVSKRIFVIFWWSGFEVFNCRCLTVYQLGFCWCIQLHLNIKGERDHRIWAWEEIVTNSHKSMRVCVWYVDCVPQIWGVVRDK